MWLLFCCLMWVVVLCWIDCVWPSKECAWCACDHSVHLSVPSIGFVYICVCRKLSPHLIVVILHTMWSGKNLQLLCILSSGVLCLSAISMMYVQIMLAVCILVGMVV